MHKLKEKKIHITGGLNGKFISIRMGNGRKRMNSAEEGSILKHLYGWADNFLILSSQQ